MIIPENNFLSNSFNSVVGSFHPSYLLTILNNNIYEGSFPRNLIDPTNISCTIVHERIHWHQFAGTTWGNLCLLMEQCRIDNFINANYHSNLQKIINDLKDIRILDDYSPHEDVHQIDHESGIFIQNWIDDSLSQLIFSRGDESVVKIPNINYCVPTALTDLYLSIIEYHGYKSNKTVDELDNLFTYKDFGFAFFKNELLSVKDLLEGQARASEFVHLTNLIFGVKDNNEYNKYILPFFNDNSYWKAFNLYLSITGKNPTNSIELNIDLVKFCLLVDISLSVPWPPFISDKILDYTSWRSFYPTYRFLFACFAAKENDFDIDIFNLNHLDSYTTKICSVLKWLTPNLLAENYLSINSERRKTFKKSWESKDFKLSKEHNFHDFLYLVFSMFSETRLKASILVNNIGLATIGDYAPEYAKFLFDDDEKHMNDSPLNIKGESKKLLTPLNEKQFNWLLIWILHNNLLQNNILQSKNIKFDNLPFDIFENQKNSFLETLKKVYSSLKIST